MKKAGFTLAEVLITLMILGIIAALTIPSLIQNTQKKEQVVQLKKGLSMINQAITMNYALEQEDLSDKAGNVQAVIDDILKKRLAVTNDNSVGVKTQDGLAYYLTACDGTYDKEEDITSGNCTFEVVISTKPDALEDAVPGAVSSGPGNLNGYYQFYAGNDRVVPSAENGEDTAAILYAKDVSAAGSNAGS